MQLLSTITRFTDMTRERKRREEPMMETAEIAVDLWVHSNLSAQYKQVLDEPVPQELLHVLDIQFESCGVDRQ